MIRLLHWFESGINAVLIILMAIVVLLTTVDLGWIIFSAIMTAPAFRLEVSQLLELFGAFLLVLIGVELLETVRIFVTDKTVHLEVILSVGLVAITRKVIVLEPKQLEGLTILAIAAIILALATSYYLVRAARAKPGASASHVSA